MRAESREVMSTNQRLARLVHGFNVELSVDMRAPPAIPDARVARVPDAIPVAAGARTIAGVEAIGGLADVSHPDVVPSERVHGSLQLPIFDVRRGSKANDLPDRVHSRV